MILIAEGTRSPLTFTDEAHVKEMADGFCRRIFDKTAIRPREYFTGPTFDGLYSWRRSLEMSHAAIAYKLARPEKKVFLVGYSRGGAACIQAATWLNDLGLQVDAMFLFDAVDRDVILDCSRIPGNVVKAYHAIRDPEGGSRPYFGNCQATSTRMEEKYFRGTHAALGGLPGTGDQPMKVAGKAPELTLRNARAVALVGFVEQPRQVPRITLAEDREAAASAWAWMSGHLYRHGVL